MNRYALSTINEAASEDHVDTEFSSMAELEAYVAQCGHDWTSLVVIVLPPKENKNEAR
jgi:hypothetical protein